MKRKEIFVVVLALGLAAVGSASAACSNATLKGDYGFTLTGVNSSAVLTAIVGQITANGAGGLTGTQTMSDNGVISSNVALTGSYAISSNCKGTATITPTGSSAAHYTLVIDSKNTQVEMVQTDKGYTLYGYAVAQGTATCTVAGEKGIYGYHGGGWQTNPSLIPVALDGLVTADGLGNFTGTETVSSGGVIVSGTITGTYTVNANCTGTTTSTFNGKTSHTNVVFANSGHTVFEITTDAGVISINVVQKQ